MTEAEITEVAAWIAEEGLAGRAETTVVAGFCDRVVAFGLPLARAIVFIDTLHPVYEGRMFRWEREKPEATLAEYGRSTEGEVAERWRSSPFYRLLASGESLLHRRIAADSKTEFTIFPELHGRASR
jgi:adenylate cyclase